MIAPRRRQSHHGQAFLFPPPPHGLKNLPLRRQRRPKRRHREKLLMQPCSIEKLAPCSRENPVSEMETMETVLEATPEERKENTISLMNEEFRSVSEISADIPGIPLAPSIKNSKPGVIFVLEKASLVPAYVGRTYEILNPDKHADFMRKKKMNPYDYRPDIVHEVLVDILGSRLNMAGLVKAVYVKTDQGLLIRIEPHVNVPPTLGKFCSLMSQLLQKFSIKARGKGEKLMRLIENPLDKHLPLNSLKIGLSFSSSKAVILRDYVTTISNDCTPVFIIGAMAHGKIDFDYTDDLISVSSLPLSAGVCVRRICCELERQWEIL